MCCIGAQRGGSSKLDHIVKIASLARNNSAKGAQVKLYF
jgi:hypothetical protein